jgi:endonuclease-8
MPEGDSIAKDAIRLRPILEGNRIESVYGTSASFRSNSARVIGEVVSAIRTVGKNLIIDFSSGYSLRVHLAMTGRWVILTSDRPIPGAARAALSTAGHHAVCFNAPTVEVQRTKTVDLELGRLGPDLLSTDFDPDNALIRARAFPTDPLARVLLDQRVVAGIGNVYKSEVAFLTGLYPLTPIKSISDDQLRDVFTRARALMTENVGSGRRTTTGSRAPDRDLWVYGRAGRPCRRCAARIAEKRFDDRVTYWCTGCQPIPA